VASRRLQDAKQKAEEAEQEWSAVASRPLPPGAGALDLDRLDAHLRTLRGRSDVAGRVVTEASAQQALCAKEVVEASVERRKLELWLERLQSAETDAAARAEQKAFDELAASGWRARP
jgi:flagellar export protein FliJ